MRTGARGPVVLLMTVLVALACASCSQQTAAVKRPAAKTVAGKTVATVTTIPARPSTGCSGAAQAELTMSKQTLEVDGMSRWYLISTPPGSGDRPLPLVVDFHGLDEGAVLEALTTQFSPFAQAHGFMVAFPQGTGSPIGWDTTPGPKNFDLDFVSAMLDKIETTQCVDETRIYATGLSDGAFMTSLVACAMSNRFAAFAPVSGVQLASPCAATRRISILAFHGTADPILHFNGGIGTAVLSHAIGKSGGPAPSISVPPAKLNGPGYPATVAAWAKRDGCSPDATNTRITPHMIQRVYKCPAGTAVEFYIILGGGHAWPGSKFSESIAAITGPTTFEINATSIIWDFFKQHQL